MKRTYYWCLTFNLVWVIKCYTDDGVKRYEEKYLTMWLVNQNDCNEQ